MSNNVSQKCVPPQNWPTTQDANGVITSAGPPITALNRIRYKCETSHSREETDMRRKAEVLQYKKNSFKWTKKERFAYLAKHPSSRPPTNSIQTAPTGILCGDAYQSGARVIPSGNDGNVLSSPNASNVPIDPKNKVNLYYDDTVPLTNWSSQTQYTEVGAYDGEIIRYEFPVPDAIAPLILTNDKFRKALSYYFDGAMDVSFSVTDYPQIGSFNSDPTKISLWNVSAVTDMSGAFLNATFFNENIDNWDVSIVTDMSDMFYGCSAFNQTLNKWKTSSVTDMSNMFNGCSSFNKPLNAWNVANVTVMNGMFSGCVVFNKTLTNWNVASVNSMENMFNGCKLFNQPLTNWIAVNVTNMSYMFNGCSKFNQELRDWAMSIDTVLNGTLRMFFETALSKKDINDKTIIDASGTPIQKTNSMLGTTYQNYFSTINIVHLNNSSFRQALEYYFTSTNGSFTSSELDNLGRLAYHSGNIAYWDVSEVTDMSGAFKDKITFNSNINDWDVSNVTDMSSMFYNCKKFDEPLNNWVVSRVTDMSSMFYECSIFNQPLNNWVVESVSNMTNMFYNCSNFSQSLREWELSINTVLNNTTNMFLGANTATSLGGITIIDVSGTPIMLPVDQTEIDRMDYFLKTNIFYANNLNFKSAISYYFDTSSAVPNIFSTTELIQIGKFNNAITKNNISYWDVTAVVNMTDAFLNRDTFNVDINGWDVSSVTNMSGLFSGCLNFNQLLSRWDVSSVANMSNMFYKNNGFNQDLNTWDTSNVKNMSGMFRECSIFNSNINIWDVTKVTDMSNMFRDCPLFNSSLDRWTVTNVETTENMFRGCSSFNKSLNSWKLNNALDVSNMFYECILFNQPLNEWVLSSAINMRGLLSGCETFNKPLTNLLLSNATDMSFMFYDCYNFNQSLNHLNVSNISNMSYMFVNCLSFTQTLHEWDVSNVNNMSNMFYNCKKYNASLNNWNVSSVTNMSYMFYGCDIFNTDLNVWNVSKVANMNSMFYGALSFNNDITDWNVSNVTNMNYMFKNCSSFSQSIRSWNINTGINNKKMFENTDVSFNDTSGNTIVDEVGTPIFLVDIESESLYRNYFYSTSSMVLNDVIFNHALVYYFDGSNNVGFTERELFQIGRFTDLSGNNSSTRFHISHWNVSAVTVMTGAFKNKKTFNENINMWDVSKVTDMSELFYGCTNFNQPLNNWDVAKVTNMSYMFHNCSKFNQFLNNWIVSKVTNMSYMFHYCSKFDQDINNWAVSKVTNMSYMFRDCSKFNQSLDLWDVSNVTEMSDMFYACTSLNQSLRMWRTNQPCVFDRMFYTTQVYPTTNYTTTIIDVSGTPIIEYFIGSLLILIDSTFIDALNYYFEGIVSASIDGYTSVIGTASLTPDNISYWNVSGVTDMSGAFQGRTSFNQNLNRWDVSSVSDMSNMFSGDASYNQPLNLWNVNNVKYFNNMFNGCTSFDQDINSWDICDTSGSSIEMSGMFNGCLKFNQPLDNWNVSKVTTMESMFNGCSSFNQDLLMWEVGNVTNMNSMFYNCTNFTYLLEIWDVSSNVTSMFYPKNNTVSTLDSSGTPISSHFLGRLVVESNSSFIQYVDLYFKSHTTQNVGMYTDSSYNRDKYISYWNVTGVTDMAGAFQGRTGFNQNLNRWDVSAVSNMSNMFDNCTNFNQPLNLWNVSKVTNFYRMFSMCSEFNQDINSWVICDTSGSDVNMNSMFDNCFIFDSPLDNWNVSKVTTMEYMFYGCSSFNQDLLMWEVGNVTNMNSMFSATDTFDKPLNNWDVSNVTDMGNMFKESVFNQPLNMWDISNVVRMTEMFEGGAISQDLRKWNVYNAIPDVVLDDSDAQRAGFIPTATFWMIFEFNYNPKGLPTIDDVKSDYGVDYSKGTTAGVTRLKSNEVYDASNSDTYIDLIVHGQQSPSILYFNGTFKMNNDTFRQAINYYFDISETSLNNVQKIIVGKYNNSSNKNISLWNVSNVTDMSGAFKNINHDFNEYLDYWDVSSVTDMSNMFYGCSNFNQPMESWNVSNVINMESMFFGCINFNKSLTTWDVTSVENMNRMFYGCSNFNQNLNAWDIYNVTDMTRMFYNNTVLNQTFIHWEPNVNIILEHMFTSAPLVYPSTVSGIQRIIDGTPTYYYFSRRLILTDNNFKDALNIYFGALSTSYDFTPRQLIQIGKYTDTSGNYNKTNIMFWDVKNVTNMNNAFENKYNFNESLNLWDFSNVINMQGMFKGCTSYDQPVNWDVSNVTNMSEMFYDCANFNQPLDTWNVSKVTNMSEMFYGCTKFNQSLNTWDISNVTNISRMFYNCLVFESSLNNWNVSSVNNMQEAFYDCSLFWSINLRMWHQYTSNTSYMFYKSNYTAVYDVDNIEIIDSSGSPTSSFFIGKISLTNDTFYDALDYYFGGNNTYDFNEYELISIGRFNNTSGSSSKKNIKYWDVYNVTVMTNAFRGRYDFNESLNHWDVTNVSRMDYMFDMSGCQGDASFNNPPFTWMTKFGRNNLINTDYMFRNCKLLRYIVLQYWPIGNKHRPSPKIVSSIGMFADTNVWKPLPLDEPFVDNNTKLWDLGPSWGYTVLPYEKIDASGTPLNEFPSDGNSFFHVGLGEYNVGMPLWVPAHSQQLYYS